MSYKVQMKMGRKIEREHYPTYKKIVAYNKRTGKIMPKEKVYENIAKNHLAEDKNYYTKLKKAGL